MSLNQFVSMVSILALFFIGCNSEPSIYPVNGKVTIDGKSYARLIVYMHPLDEPVSRFTMGIGETDENGILTIATSGGGGIAAGKYRVSFACYRTPGGKTFDAMNEKTGEGGGKKGGTAAQPINIVPSPYDSSDESPVEFTITSGDNQFEYDIPAK